MSTIVLEHLQHANSTSPDLTVGPGGEIGIGTTSPAHKIDILTSTDQQIPLRIKNSDADSHTYMRFEDNGGQYWDTGINYANNDYYLNYGGTIKARFTNAGGLDVYGSGNSILTLNIGTTAGNYSAVQVGRTDGGGTAYVTAAVTGGVPISGIPGILLGSTNGSLPAVAIQTPNSTNGHIVFNPKGTEKVRITADGDVGIGVIVPTQKLDVNGTVKATAFSGDGSALTGVVPLTVATSAPSTPSVGDQWFDTTAGINAMKVWSGSGWDQMSNKFTATGGTESTYSSGGINYKAHTFTSSGTFVAESSGSIDIMMVAGGGGGGAWVGSGGGAGGMIVRPAFAVTAQSYTVTIGAGGARGYNPGGYAGMPYVRTGDDTTAFALTAKGGGAGVSYSYEYAGGIGGSGSGGANNPSNYPSNAANQTSQPGDSGTYGFGNAGGSAPNGTGDPYPCGGGGGAGGAGGNATTSVCGNGGVGKANSYRTGSNIFYAGGGGGGHHNGTPTYSSGGNGGGGAGNSGGSYTNAQSGSANTGGGGGGGGGSGGSLSYGGYGGSGIVVVRYVV
jgi:hypothetical protein